MLFSCSKSEDTSAQNGNFVKSAGGVHWPRVVQHPSARPGEGWFCNERMEGGCLPEVVIIVSKEGIHTDYQSFKNKVKMGLSVNEFLNNEDFVNAMLLHNMDTALLEGLISGAYKFLLTHNADDGMDYLTVVDVSFNSETDDLELSALFTVRILVTVE